MATPKRSREAATQMTEMETGINYLHDNIREQPEMFQQENEGTNEGNGTYTTIEEYINELRKTEANAKEELMKEIEKVKTVYTSTTSAFDYILEEASKQNLDVGDLKQQMKMHICETTFYRTMMKIINDEPNVEEEKLIVLRERVQTLKITLKGYKKLIAKEDHCEVAAVRHLRAEAEKLSRVANKLRKERSRLLRRNERLNARLEQLGNGSV